MANTDAFALKNSGFNTFLFSEVGLQTNGSGLTILSILARLGEDPWAEAAKWAKLPKAAITDRLAQCMAQMPLCPQALLEARATASRLALLLPAPATQVAEPAAGAVQVKKWLPLALYAALALGLIVNMVLPSRHAATPPQATTADTVVPGR